MTIRELVGGEVVRIDVGNSLREAARAMKANDVGALTVHKDGQLAGIFTERDLLMACAEGAGLDSVPVTDWMTNNPDSLDPEMKVAAAADWMLAAGYRHLPVVDGGELVGMVSIKDILWALSDHVGV